MGSMSFGPLIRVEAGPGSRKERWRRERGSGIGGMTQERESLDLDSGRGRERFMHEMSIAQEVCRITQEKVGSEGCGRVVEVGLEVGDESGVEADNLLFWLEILLSEPPFAGARTAVQRVEGTALRVSYLEVRDADSSD